MRFAGSEHRLTIVLLAAMFVGQSVSSAQQAPALRSPWKTNGLAVQRFQIEGIGSRNNPLRNQLSPPFCGEELFVRFRLRYDAASIDEAKSSDQTTAGNGEFFVLWFDAVEGHDSSGHSARVPNVGIHVDKQHQNRFMVRYSPGTQRFAARLQGDRDYLVVARLWKSASGKNQPFDKLDMWVDPAGDQEFKPHASTGSANSIAQVSWIGFSTGLKTEPGDVIEVWISVPRRPGSRFWICPRWCPTWSRSGKAHSITARRVK